MLHCRVLRCVRRSPVAAAQASTTAPSSTWKKYGDTPIRFSPLRSTASSSTPISTPPTLPVPPNRLAPPNTAAASTNSSVPTRALGTDSPTRCACTRPAMAAIMPSQP